MFEKAKKLLRIETLLWVALLAAAAAAIYLFMQRADIQEQLAEVESQINLSDGDLVALGEERASKSEEPAGKAEELARRQRQIAEEEPDQTFASRGDAQDISAQLIAFAAEQEIAIGNFETDEMEASVAGATYPAISYAMVATGPSDKLIGMLDIVAIAPTAKVEKLVLSRDKDDVGLWIMTLQLLVLYSEDG